MSPSPSQDESSGAIAEQEAVLARTADAVDASSVRERGLALWSLGDLLYKAGRYGDSVERLGQASSTLSQFSDLPVAVVSTRVRRAHALLALHRDGEALEMLDRAIDSGETVPELPDLMPSAFALRMFVLQKMGRQDEAYAAADSLISEFGPGETQEQRRFVVEALIVQGNVRLLRGDRKLALVAYDEALTRSAQEEYDALHDRLVEALLNKAVVLEQEGQTEEALAANEAVLAELQRGPGPKGRDAYAEAWSGRLRLITGGKRRRIYRLLASKRSTPGRR